MEVLGSFRLSRRKRDIVVEEQVSEDHLDVRGGEEATGACRLSLAKGQTLGARRSELMSVGLHLGRHSLLVKALAVKCFGVGVNVRIGGHGVTRHGDVSSHGKDGAILELEGPRYFAVESH